MIRRDVHLALRGLRRVPGFAVLAVLTLGLGIGLATAVFTVAEALLLRRLPVVEQDRIVVLWGRAPDGSFDHFPLTLTHAREYARASGALQRAAFLAYEGASPVSIRDGDRISRLHQALVSGDYFEVLGTRPLLGRAIGPADDVPGAPPVAVLSHRAWQARFAGEQSVIGRRITRYETGVSYAIVGVMPEGLDYPRGVDFWAPVTPERTGPQGDAPNAHVDVIGRLARNASAERARAELTAWFGRAEASAPLREVIGVVNTLPRLVLGETRPAILVVAAASALLLLITCINVANLLLVRGLARTREIAVRSALGASRGTVIGQLLVENAALALLGGALGVILASVAVRGFTALAPSELPRLAEIGVNATALAGAFGITVLALLVSGLAPAIITSRVDLQGVLRSDTRQSPSRRSRMTAEAMVAAQVALAVLVLAAAGVIGRSLVELQRADLSLDPSHLLITEIALSDGQYGDADAQHRLLDRLLPALAQIRGVRGVSPAVAIPFAGTGGWDGRPSAAGQPAHEVATNPMLNMEVVGPDYFRTLDVPLLRGRSFTDADDATAPRVTIISEAAARHYWPGEDPIGKRLIMGRGPEPSFTVVGIVPETRYRDLREARPSIYFPFRQSFFPFAPRHLVIRTSVAPASIVPAVREAIRSAAAGADLATAAPFEAFLDAPLAQPRLNATLLALFAAAAVALAGVGLFGVMATMVRQRTREMGVRMALGATAGDVRRMVLGRGMAVAATGTAAGLVGALGANRLVASMLYGVSPTDLPSFAGVVVLLLVVAAVASALPARATTRIDPVIALRGEG